MLGLWSLKERRNRAEIIEVFKIMRSYTSISVDSLFEPSKDIRTHGHSSIEQTRICATTSSVNELLTDGTNWTRILSKHQP